MNNGVFMMVAGILALGIGSVLTILIITIPIAIIFFILSPVLFIIGFFVWFFTRGKVRCMRCHWSGMKKEAMSHADPVETQRS
ncbi:MAG: hypothetical protein KGI69_00990 [Patescibacteria group bacterium]|nr:hypothetical protein [Patescibacteria group bacterium]